MYKYVVKIKLGLIMSLLAFSCTSYSQGSNRSRDSISKHSFPKGVAFVGSENRINTKYISKASIRAQQGISCISVGTDYHGFCNVASYDLLIISDNRVVYADAAKSALFSEKTKEHFAKLKNADKVVIYNIQAKFPIGDQCLPSIVYEVN